MEIFIKGKGKTAVETSSVVSTGEQTQTPYYDDVVLKQEVELKENVAYGQIR